MVNKEKEAIRRLKRGIVILAQELEMDTDLALACIANESKDKLISRFIELKELRLKQENARLVGLLLG